MSEQPNHSNARPDRPVDDVESASLDSFPASDPPKWSTLHVGPPVHSDPVPKIAEKRDSTADSPTLRP